PPPHDKIAQALDRVGDAVRQARPSVIGVQPRNGLKQVGSKILPTKILNGLGQVFDAQASGIHCRLSGGKQASVIIKLRSLFRDLLGLRRLAGSRNSSQQLEPTLDGLQRRSQSASKIIDTGANPMELVSEMVELGIAQVRPAQIVLEGVQFSLPAGD